MTRTYSIETVGGTKKKAAGDTESFTGNYESTAKKDGGRINIVSITKAAMDDSNTAGPTTRNADYT